MTIIEAVSGLFMGERPATMARRKGESWGIYRHDIDTAANVGECRVTVQINDILATDWEISLE